MNADMKKLQCMPELEGYWGSTRGEMDLTITFV